MAVITVRVPDKLRRAMTKVKNVNWSAVVRDAIESRVELELEENGRDWDRVRRANKLADRIFNEMQRKYGHVPFNSAETIRYWRERRYGSTYWTRRSR